MSFVLISWKAIKSQSECLLPGVAHVAEPVVETLRDAPVSVDSGPGGCRLNTNAKEPRTFELPTTIERCKSWAERMLFVLDEDEDELFASGSARNGALCGTSLFWMRCEGISPHGARGSDDHNIAQATPSHGLIVCLMLHPSNLHALFFPFPLDHCRLLSHTATPGDPTQMWHL